MTYTPVFPTLERLVKLYHLEKTKRVSNGRPLGKLRNLIIVVPDRNEDVETALNTIAYAARANSLAHEYNIPDRVIDRVMLSDQSTEKSKIKQNKERLESMVKILREEIPENIFPEISYFRIGSELKDELKIKSGHLKLPKTLMDEIAERDEIYGKGWNMYLSLILQDCIERNNHSTLLYLDADYRNRSPEQILALSLPLSHLDYSSVTGTFTRYHKNDNGNMERGGRVNAATGAFFDMLYEKNVMGELMGYALSGDQGAKFKHLKRLFCPSKYGIETAIRIQFHSSVNSFNKNLPLLFGENHIQPEIHGSDDTPIANGRSKSKITEGIDKMSRDISESALASIGYGNLKRLGYTADTFMSDFESHQILRMDAWRDASLDDYGEILPISGGLSDDELRTVTLESVRESVKTFFDSRAKRSSLRKDFLPSVETLNLGLGNEYHRFGQSLNSYRIVFC